MSAPTPRAERALRDYVRADGPVAPDSPLAVMRWAADEIDRLREAVDRLTAFGGLAVKAARHGSETSGRFSPDWWWSPSAGTVHRHAAADRPADAEPLIEGSRFVSVIAEMIHLRAQRHAALALADDLDRDAPARPAAPVIAARLRAALGASS